MMTIQLHDYHELQERPSKHLKVWKGWHITFYILAAFCGLLNYSFFQNTAQFFDDNCILYPKKLAFHLVKLPENDTFINNVKINNYDNINNVNKQSYNETAQPKIDVDLKLKTFNETENNGSENGTKRTKRESHENEIIIEDLTVINNLTKLNSTHRLVLFTPRTLFASESECQYPMYMPVLSTAFALVWTTLFIVCPGGGSSRSGLHQPWRILAPALLFTIVMLALTARSFVQTSGGLNALCAAFSNVTNTTTCSTIDRHIESAWGLKWGVEARILATKSFSTATWVFWGLASVLLMARCLAAPDFVVRRTGVYVTSDPNHKITPYLRKASKNNSQRKIKTEKATLKDDVSIRSEPTTMTTELVTSGFRDIDSCPTSSITTPTKHHGQRDEMMELVYIPQERNRD